MKKLLNSNSWWFLFMLTYLISWPIWVMGREIQPYYNCEVYSVNPRLRICREWSMQLSDLLRNDIYQKTYCSTFLRQLLLHQAVLSAVVTSKVQKTRMKLIPLTSSYPFNQHGKLPSDRKITYLNELKIILFDFAWAKIPLWENMIP